MASIDLGWRPRAWYFLWKRFVLVLWFRIARFHIFVLSSNPFPPSDLCRSDLWNRVTLSLVLVRNTCCHEVVKTFHLVHFNVCLVTKWFIYNNSWDWTHSKPPWVGEVSLQRPNGLTVSLARFMNHGTWLCFIHVPCRVFPLNGFRYDLSEPILKTLIWRNLRVRNPSSHLHELIC